jgi:hypothetical protein
MSYTTVLIRIDYTSVGNSLFRKGEFPLKGRNKEAAALDFWKWIKREHPYPCELEKVTVDGDDITDKVIGNR